MHDTLNIDSDCENEFVYEEWAIKSESKEDPFATVLESGTQHLYLAFPKRNHHCCHRPQINQIWDCHVYLSKVSLATGTPFRETLKFFN